MVVTTKQKDALAQLKELRHGSLSERNKAVFGDDSVASGDSGDSVPAPARSNKRKLEEAADQHLHDAVDPSDLNPFGTNDALQEPLSNPDWSDLEDDRKLAARSAFEESEEEDSDEEVPARGKFEHSEEDVAARDEEDEEASTGEESGEEASTDGLSEEEEEVFEQPAGRSVYYETDQESRVSDRSEYDMEDGSEDGSVSSELIDALDRGEALDLSDVEDGAAVGLQLDAQESDDEDSDDEDDMPVLVPHQAVVARRAVIPQGQRYVPLVEMREDGNVWTRRYFPTNQHIYRHAVAQECNVCLVVKRPEDFYINRRKISGIHSTCIQCRAQQRRVYLYGQQIENYNQRLIHQENTCPVCLQIIGQGGLRAAVDHNHGNGEVRSVLCMLCNSAFGRFHDGREATIETLKRLLQYERGEFGPPEAPQPIVRARAAMVYRATRFVPAMSEREGANIWARYSEERIRDLTVPEKVCRRCGELKGNEMFRLDRYAADGLTGNCRPCTAIYQRERRYNIPDEQYQRLLARHDFHCPICLSVFDLDNPFALRAPNVDHNHANGFIRGVICNGCNGGLSHLGDGRNGTVATINRLIEYARTHQVEAQEDD